MDEHNGSYTEYVNKMSMDNDINTEYFYRMSRDNEEEELADKTYKVKYSSK